MQIRYVKVLIGNMSRCYGYAIKYEKVVIERWQSVAQIRYEKIATKKIHDNSTFANIMLARRVAHMVNSGPPTSEAP